MTDHSSVPFLRLVVPIALPNAPLVGPRVPRGAPLRALQSLMGLIGAEGGAAVAVEYRLLLGGHALDAPRPARDDAVMGYHSCPECGCQDLQKHGPPSRLDGRRGFSCAKCGLVMAPRRRTAMRALLRVAPFIAALAGVGIMALAVLAPEGLFHRVRTFLAGACVSGFGVWMTRPAWQELGRPMPAWHED